MTYSTVEMTNFNYGKSDLEAAKLLDSFIPDKLFDAHMHISNKPIMGKEIATFDEYKENMKTLVGERTLLANMIPFPTSNIKTHAERCESFAFLTDALSKNEGCVGEILVLPEDTPEYIESQLVSDKIRGLKCYHTYANRPDTFNAGIEEYLPESAWELANERGLAITLHMVRTYALADDINRNYIKTMAKKYPNAKLILAHAARAFAAWTAIEYIDELRQYENIFCDFSGICESPAMIKIIKSFGTGRCMFGTDWPVSMLAGKAISIADTFYWISEGDLRSFKPSTPLNTRLVGTESLMALREACILTELSPLGIEDLFYNTAYSLFK